MRRSLALPVTLGLLAAAPAAAQPSALEELTTMLADFGFALGRIDYCTTGGQALFDDYVRGLGQFNLNPVELQALLATTQEAREKSRLEASQRFSGGPCPADVRQRIDEARAQIDAAWRSLVANAAIIDLRPAVAGALERAGSATPSASQAASPAPAPRPASAPAPAAPSSAGLCSKGRAVSVLYAGNWYPAKVLDGPDSLGTCLVAYDGYESNWDEWVNASRMRPASASEPAPTQSQPTTIPTSVPPGKYSCYTFDAGALNYTYTDVQIIDGSRYSVGNKSGTYTLSGTGTMRFTGTMSNATGTFSMKSTGRPQIDLVFNGDARASMACTRAN